MLQSNSFLQGNWPCPSGDPWQQEFSRCYLEFGCPSNDAPRQVVQTWIIYCPFGGNNAPWYPPWTLRDPKVSLYIYQQVSIWSLTTVWQSCPFLRRGRKMQKNTSQGGIWSLCSTAVSQHLWMSSLQQENHWGNHQRLPPPTPTLLTALNMTKRSTSAERENSSTFMANPPFSPMPLWKVEHWAPITPSPPPLFAIDWSTDFYYGCQMVEADPLKTLDSAI